MCTGSSLGVKSGPSVTLTPPSLLVPWSWKGRATPLLPLCAVRPVQSVSACTRVTFNFTLSLLMYYHPYWMCGHYVRLLLKYVLNCWSTRASAGIRTQDWRTRIRVVGTVPPTLSGCLFCWVLPAHSNLLDPLNNVSFIPFTHIS